jgi:hypothetical protein
MTETKIIEIHDLTREMEILDLLGLQGMSDPDALSQFQACASDLDEWTPSENLTMAELMHGLSHMLMGAYSLHNHADMQRLFGKQDQAAALVPFEMAQNCLRKAVRSLEIAMRNTARDAIGPLSPEEAGTGESFH